MFTKLNKSSALFNFPFKWCQARAVIRRIVWTVEHIFEGLRFRDLEKGDPAKCWPNLKISALLNSPLDWRQIEAIMRRIVWIIEKIFGGLRFRGLRSPVSGLRSPVSGLRSPVSGLRSPVSVFETPSSRSSYQENCVNRRAYFWGSPFSRSRKGRPRKMLNRREYFGGSPFSRSRKGRPRKMLTKSKNLCAVELPARLASNRSNYEANCLNHWENIWGSPFSRSPVSGLRFRDTHSKPPTVSYFWLPKRWIVFAWESSSVGLRTEINDEKSFTAVVVIPQYKSSWTWQGTSQPHNSPELPWPHSRDATRSV